MVTPFVIQFVGEARSSEATGWIISAGSLVRMFTLSESIVSVPFAPPSD